MTNMKAKKVRCIDATHAADLEEGQVYTVTKADTGIYALQGVNSRYLASRFEIVEYEEEKDLEWEVVGPGILVTSVDNHVLSITRQYLLGIDTTYDVHTKGWKIGSYPNLEAAKNSVEHFLSLFQFKE